MAKYLIKTTETYRADTEKEAAELISEAKHSSKYVLGKYTSSLKEIKQKGEVVEEYYKVELTKVFDNEKEPIGSYNNVKYTMESAFDGE